MVDLGTEEPNARWVCPNDRQLTLRSKLDIGWSTKAYVLTHSPKRVKHMQLTEEELAKVKEMMDIANAFDMVELERVRTLVRSVVRLKMVSSGDGVVTCILCGEPFKFFSGVRAYRCEACDKRFCSKCGSTPAAKSNRREELCKICYDTRELWMKSGAWFTRGLPACTFVDDEEPLPRSARWSSVRLPPSPTTMERPLSAAGSSSGDSRFSLEDLQPRRLRSDSRLSSTFSEFEPTDLRTGCSM